MRPRVALRPQPLVYGVERHLAVALAPNVLQHLHVFEWEAPHGSLHVGKQWDHLVNARLALVWQLLRLLPQE